jgi:hypothetical protein
LTGLLSAAADDTAYLMIIATLGEHRIREINDEINKLLRQKHYWEIRIRELGGNLSKGKQIYDVEGKELPGAPGYKYFGAGKLSCIFIAGCHYLLLLSHI